MGVVYEGLREDIGARAAIKVLRPEFARQEEIAVRFFNEARAVNIIKHPAIVRIFDYGRLESGTAYLAMEFLEGETLRARLQRMYRLSEVESIRLGRQIASGLAAAHAKQIIHRDLKPDNVFVVPDAEAPGGERTKILDFGIAKLAFNKLAQTRRDALMGTPVYMAPEQCRGAAEVDDRADVYSLGIILFEMLSGQPPFTGHSVADVMGMHMFNAPPPLKDLVPGLDLRLQRLLESMLHKNSAQRPSMEEVAQQLKLLGNLSSDVISREAMAQLGRQSSDGVPAVKGVPRLARDPEQQPTLVSPGSSTSEDQTRLIRANTPGSAAPLFAQAGHQQLPLSASGPTQALGRTQRALGGNQPGEQGLMQRPWVLPVLCLIVAALVCLLVALSGCS